MRMRKKREFEESPNTGQDEPAKSTPKEPDEKLLTKPAAGTKVVKAAGERTIPRDARETNADAVRTDAARTDEAATCGITLMREGAVKDAGISKTAAVKKDAEMMTDTTVASADKAVRDVITAKKEDASRTDAVTPETDTAEPSAVRECIVKQTAEMRATVRPTVVLRFAVKTTGGRANDANTII